MRSYNNYTTENLSNSSKTNFPGYSEFVDEEMAQLTKLTHKDFPTKRLVCMYLFAIIKSTSTITK